jgi:hypothetical protein
MSRQDSLSNNPHLAFEQFGYQGDGPVSTSCIPQLGIALGLTTQYTCIPNQFC